MMFLRSVLSIAFLLSCPLAICKSQVALAQLATNAKATSSAVVDFVDTSFENASPLWYEFDSEGTLQLNLVYDHERSSPNRAAGHFHFKITGKPNAKVQLELNNLNNVWNGTAASVAQEMKSAVISHDGRAWTSVATDVSKDNRVTMQIMLPQSGELFVARVEPYRISDLNRLLVSIKNHALVKVDVIGKTYEGRPLEIVQIGKENAPYRLFLRARAHPWEAGGNWILEGLIARLLQDDPVARRCLEKYSVTILPMANKDGVARGRTRFNMLGKDLNRNWDKPADPLLAPENGALEKWLESMIEQGRTPHLAIELHNDGNGKLHISRPPVPNLEQHVERMRVLESLLRRYTWFTEGSTDGAFRNSGTLGDGWLERYGIDSAVHEFNCHWIAGISERPLGKHWKNYGEQLVFVFEDYFDNVKP
ncbi:MAG: M14 family zinc carboxypeptidase [Planctomycetota bacterium]|nr:M14 family zinc carboxypeptidase [Planctomycetota bacterium]